VGAMNLNGKVVGASLEDDGTTIIHVQVSGRVPVKMSAAASLSLDPSPETPAPAKRPPPISEEERRKREPLSPWPGVIPCRPETPAPSGAPTPRAVLNAECSACHTIVPLVNWSDHAARCVPVCRYCGGKNGQHFEGEECPYDGLMEVER
jgi:hypothetical protein